MIDLRLTRAGMLEDIGAAPETRAGSVSDLEDPALKSARQVRLILRAHERDEFFSELKAALRARFERVPSERLQRDLFVPLKKAIGNSFKWGNHRDASKWLTVEIVATHLGTVASVSDEGIGFDVEQILSRFLSDQQYFTHGGCGFAYFAKTSSAISFADGGRTLLLRFLADPEPGEPVSAADLSTFGSVADARLMSVFLDKEVPYFRESSNAIESCRVYAPSRTNEGADELTYVVRQRMTGRANGKTTVLTGRILSESEAEADASMASQLRDAGVGVGKEQGLHIPRPLGAFREPSLSLFLLDPSGPLRERAKKLQFEPLSKVLITIALGLAAIHESSVSAQAEVGLSDTLEKHRKSRLRVEAKLPPPSAGRASACYSRLAERVGSLQAYQPVPIHGSLTWGCIVRSERKWELYRFERSRLSHPGLDVGAFLAELLRFYVLRGKGNADFYTRGREVFLEAYFKGTRPPWAEQLDWFVASALLERLDRMLRQEDKRWEPRLDALLAQIERALT